MRYALCRINFDNWGFQNPTTFFSGGCSGAVVALGSGGTFSKTTVVIFWVDKLCVYVVNVSNKAVDIVWL